MHCKVWDPCYTTYTSTPRPSSSHTPFEGSMEKIDSRDGMQIPHLRHEQGSDFRGRQGTTKLWLSFSLIVTKSDDQTRRSVYKKLNRSALTMHNSHNLTRIVLPRHFPLKSFEQCRQKVSQKHGWMGGGGAWWGPKVIQLQGMSVNLRVGSTTKVCLLESHNLNRLLTWRKYMRVINIYLNLYFIWKQSYYTSLYTNEIHCNNNWTLIL